MQCMRQTITKTPLKRCRCILFFTIFLNAFRKKEKREISRHEQTKYKTNLTEWRHQRIFHIKYNMKIIYL